MRDIGYYLVCKQHEHKVCGVPPTLFDSSKTLRFDTKRNHNQ